MSRIPAIALFALLFAGSAHVSAQPDVTGRVTDLLEEATTAYDSLQMQASLVKLQQASEIIEEYGVHTDDAAQVYIMLGLVRHVENAGTSEVLNAFIEAVRVERQVTIPQYYSTPELEELLSQARAWVPEETPATAEVATTETATTETATTETATTETATAQSVSAEATPPSSVTADTTVETTTTDAQPAEQAQVTNSGQTSTSTGGVAPTESTTGTEAAQTTVESDPTVGTVPSTENTQPSESVDGTPVTPATTETPGAEGGEAVTTSEAPEGDAAVGMTPYVQGATMESTVTAGEAIPTGSIGESLDPEAELTPSTVPYLWEYRGVSADYANFHHQTLTTRLETGPNGFLGLSLGHNYLQAGLFNVASELGVATAVATDGDLSWGPAYHGSVFGGYPLVDWRGKRTTRVIVGRAPVGISETGEVLVTTNYADVGVPAHRRLIVETGVTTGTMNFETTDRNTSIGVGLRYRIDWDFDIEIVNPNLEETYQRHLSGGWYIASHVYPVTFSGRDGATAGAGVDLDAVFPFMKRRDNPVLLALGGSYMPDESFTLRAGLNFGLRRW